MGSFFLPNWSPPDDPARPLPAEGRPWPSDDDDDGDGDGLNQVVIGKQYQNHNSRPGPVYAGGGYTPINTVGTTLNFH